MERFAVSQPVRRREDPALLRGQGSFVDDMSPRDVLHAHFLRSPIAHGRILGIDAAAAAAVPGVRAVYTAADIALGGIPTLVRPAEPFLEARQPILARDRVRYVGEPVAAVVAETPEAARDAAEAIVAEYADLPTVVDAGAALAPDAPPLHGDGNLCFAWTLGDRAAADRAFAGAAHVITLDERNNRVVLAAMETRAALGRFSEDRFELTVTTQMPNRMKIQLAKDVFGLPEDRFRILVRDVGGGFGGKNALYPEYALVLHAARALGRPVKWVGGRDEAFIADTHGRDNIVKGALALDAQGNFLAVRLHSVANIGAYTSNGAGVSPTNVATLANAYRTPVVDVDVRTVFTNTAPVDAYRGAGRPETIYLMERLVDVAAFDLGIDPIELRRRNHIPESAFPYASPTGLRYEHAAFDGMLDAALAAADRANYPARLAEARGRGRLRGFGICQCIERAGGGPGLGEAARLAFAEDGRLLVFVGSQDNGQAHATSYSQIVHGVLGLDFDRIEIVQGDTDLVRTGTGTGGSWSITMGGSAIHRAAGTIVEKAKRYAADRLEAAEADLVFEDGRYRVAGTDLALDFGEAVRTALDAGDDLETEDRFEPGNFTYPYGCHAAEVEVDPETGRVEVVAYAAVHDFGVALNPMLLAGQLHGGLAQGIGQALLEHTVYDDAGQLLSGSFTDYAIPRADDLPPFRFEIRETPSNANPLGVKGCGETGATFGAPAAMNALLDALKPLGIRHIDMPATPEAVWRAVRAARAA